MKYDKMSLSKTIGNLMKTKPIIVNSIIYGSFYTSAEFLQQTYRQHENNLKLSRNLHKIDNPDPPFVIGSSNKNTSVARLNGVKTNNNRLINVDGYDWPVLRRYVVYGYFLAGPILHGWYAWLDKFYIGKAGATVIKKLFFDQFILTPPLIVLFFTSMSLMEGKDDILQECGEKFIKTFQTSCLYWLPMQFINFLIVPPTFRVVFVSVAAFVWVNILCHLKRTPISNDQ